MEWLDHDLRNLHGGYYRYREARGLGRLEPGSLVFFYKNKLIVGSAVVEKASRPLEGSEIQRCEEIYKEENCAGMKNIVKFFTNSIWVRDEHDLVNESEFKEITGKNLDYYVSVNPDEVMKLYGLVAKKREEMEKRSLGMHSDLS